MPPREGETRRSPQGDEAKRRIETQIHRRKKAKAVPPLEAEWQAGSDEPPNLRTPSDRMQKTPKRPS
ncbi:hypothetical protein [Candidatus Nitrospira bockiana]